MLGLGSSTASVGAVGVAREFDLLIGRQLQDFLESSANSHENLLALVIAATLTAGNITVTASGNALSYSASPDTDSEECLTDVDNNTHDFTVILLLKGLANSAHHDLEPEAVNVDIALVLVLVGPLAAVLVLGVLPLRANTGLEKVIIRLESELGNGGDVVLKGMSDNSHVKHIELKPT